MTIRVAVWTSGMTARVGARAILMHPDMGLVGLYSHSPDKVGSDIGELIGVAPLDIVSVGGAGEIIALKPNCVYYAPFRPNIDHVVQLLQAGINIVSPLNKLTSDGYGSESQERIAAACAAGGATLYTSGIFPGNVTNVALAATVLVRRLDRNTILDQ